MVRVSSDRWPSRRLKIPITFKIGKRAIQIPHAIHLRRKVRKHHKTPDYDVIFLGNHLGENLQLLRSKWYSM